MSTKKYISFGLVAVAAFCFTGIAIAKNEQHNDTQKRVIAHGQQEVNSAVAVGCNILKENKHLTVLTCPEKIADTLSLQEDIQVFALGKPQNPTLEITSTTANQQIGASIVQANGNTGSGRKVVVLDTGYNYTHPELISSYLGGKDFVNNDADPMDDQGHGSHVAGIITADGITTTARGVAPGTGVIAGKVLDSAGSGYFSDVVEAVYWAVNGPDGVYGTTDDFKADAISLSLGTSAPYLYKGSCDAVMPDLTNAFKYAVQKNVTIVVAAGNSGNPGVSLPGCISYATTVGAVDATDKIASFSGRGNTVDISAPGVNIYSSTLGSGYASWSGTSMATPMITGTIALIKSSHPTWTHSQIESSLFTTAKDLGKRGKDADYGWGRVQANKAVQ